jgi:hypothetical protein
MQTFSWHAEKLATFYDEKRSSMPLGRIRMASGMTSLASFISSNPMLFHEKQSSPERFRSAILRLNALNG